MSQRFEDLENLAVSCGAFRAKVITTDKIKFDLYLRESCKQNACGNYNRNYACPPYVGEPEELIAKVKEYPFGMVVQTVSELEDSYDIEGMMEAAQNHSKMADDIEKVLEQQEFEYLRMTAGGCKRCSPCAKITGEPCRYPEKSMYSISSFCIDVSQLATASDMKYINGVNTVTYFSLFLLRDTKVDEV